MRNLAEKGFEIDPAILIRTLAAIGKGIARLKDVPENFWEKSKDFQNGWAKTKRSISYVVKQINDVGILSSEILPSHNALIPMFCLFSKFDKTFNFSKALHWFLLATGDGRYSGSAITVLDQDIRNINSSSSFDEAINTLVKPLRLPDTFTKDDFLKDFRDEFLRLIIYLTIFKNEAKDWVDQDVRIGYDRTDSELNEGFKPEWHHFFPKKILKSAGIEDSKLNLFANIVVLNEKANKTFTSKEPKEYLNKHNVGSQRLVEQLIPSDESFWKVNRYAEFLEKRATDLAMAANKIMEELKNG